MIKEILETKLNEAKLDDLFTIIVNEDGNLLVLKIAGYVTKFPIFIKNGKLKGDVKVENVELKDGIFNIVLTIGKDNYTLILNPNGEKLIKG